MVLLFFLIVTYLYIFFPACVLFQTEDSEINVDEDDEEDEEGEEDDEEEEIKDFEADSLEGHMSRGARPSRGGLRPSLLEESSNDF